jgi:hypothetical protein
MVVAPDAGASDAASGDAHAASDAGGSDAGRDAGRAIDGGRDAAMSVDAGRDVGIDAGRDAGIDAGHDGGADAAVAADSGVRRLECVPAVGGNELSSGMVLGANFWVGFRFQITAATTLESVGLDLQPDFGASGSVLAGVVRLTDATDGPDTPNLTGTDVVATVLVSVPSTGGASVVAGAPLSASLPAGWYALEIGIGSGGATLSGATVHSNSGGGGCTLPGSSYPFTIRQSDAMLILQGATPNLFVTVSP